MKTMSLLCALLLTADCLPLAQANTPPRITGPASVAVPEDTPALEIQFHVADEETAAEQLQLRLLVVPQNLVITNGAVLGGSGADRNVRLYLQAERPGEGSLRVLVQDAEGLTAEALVALRVTPLNDAPKIAPIPNQMVTQGQWPLVVLVRVSDPDAGRNGQTNALRVTANSSDPKILTNTANGLPITPLPGTTDFLLSLRPTTDTNRLGSTVITVTATDGLATNQTSFALTLQPRQFVVYRTPNLVAAYSDLVVSPSNDEPAGPQVSSGEVSTSAMALQTGSRAPGTWADFDGDGDLDYFTGGSTNWPPALNRADDNRPWGPLVYVEVGKGTWPVTNVVGSAWGDFDGDGRLDLLLSGKSPTPQTLVMRQVTASVFVPGVLLTRTAGPVASADIDNDGDLDFALLTAGTGQERTQVRLFLNDGAGRFEPGPSLANADTTLSFGWVDADGDGTWDLWMAQSAYPTIPPYLFRLGLFRQRQGEFHFERIGPEVPASAFSKYPQSLTKTVVTPAWGDFDNDGTMDIVSVASADTWDFPSLRSKKLGYVALLRGDNTGHFERASFVEKGIFAADQLTIISRDRDGDGDLDLAAATGITAAQVFSFSNVIRNANPPPSAPAGLQALRWGDRVWFTWGASVDANQTAALTYNLRVGLTPGGNELVPSHSDAVGGRLVATTGNAGFNRWQVLRLPEPLPLRIFWSVQAVDNSYSAGPFAPEQNLSLVEASAGAPPVIHAPERIGTMQGGTVEVPLILEDDDTEPAELEVSVSTPNPDWFNRVCVSWLPAASQTPGEWRLGIDTILRAAGETSVTLTVRDRDGFAASKTIPVTIQPLPSLQAARLETGAVTLSARGARGESAWVWRSPDLVVWERATEVRFDANGNAVWTLEGNAGNAAEFFRMETKTTEASQP